MSKQQKMILMVAGGAVALYVLYRWQQSRSSGAANQTASDGTAGAIGSQLAGQEQADTAALANQAGDLQTQETSDVANLDAQIAGLGAEITGIQGQESSDVASLIAQISSAVTGPPGPPGPPGQSVVAAATGNHKKGKPPHHHHPKPKPPVAVTSNHHAGHPNHPANVGGNHQGRHPGHQAPHKTLGAVAPVTHERKPHVSGHPATTTHQTHSSTPHPGGHAPAHNQPVHRTPPPRPTVRRRTRRR